MSEHEAIVEALRRVGYRLTPQRLMILSAIHQSPGHVSAEEILERVKATYPYMDISTVYRTLELLRKLRLATEIDLGDGTAKYELSSKASHHHLVCRDCRNTFDLDPQALEPLRMALRQEYHFEPDLDHLAIFGLCETCRGVS